MENKLLQRTKKRFIINVLKDIFFFVFIFFMVVALLIVISILLVKVIFPYSETILTLISFILIILTIILIYIWILLSWKKSRKEAEIQNE